MTDHLQPEVLPGQFQAAIVIPAGKLGDVAAAFQREWFAAVNPSLLAVARGERPPVPRYWIERSKGASKDTDLAVCLLWLLAYSRRPVRVQLGANDADQIDEVRLIVKQILKIDAPVNRLLAGKLEVQSSKILNRKTDSAAEFLTTDSLGSHGSRPDVVCINELSHLGDRAFAETLADNLDKVSTGLGIIALNAGFTSSWQEKWREIARTSPERWHFHQYAQPAPWIRADALAESRRRNSAGRYARLWHGVWSSQTGNAIDHGDIDACVVHTGPMLGTEPGWGFVGGVDIGIRKHASAFVVVGKHCGWSEEKPRPARKLTDLQRAMIDLGLNENDETEEEFDSVWHEATNRLRLADVRTWKPRPGVRVSLEAVRVAIIEAHRRFALAGVALDPFQGEHLAELLERDGVPVVLVPQTPNSLGEQATAVIESFQERTIELFGQVDVLADLKQAAIKDTGPKVRLVSPDKTVADGEEGTSHGDTVSALSFALALAKRTYSFTSVQRVEGPLLCWP